MVGEGKELREVEVEGTRIRICKKKNLCLIKREKGHYLMLRINNTLNKVILGSEKNIK